MDRLRQTSRLVVDWRKVGRNFGLAASAMIGGLIAVMGDLVQKEAASAVLRVSTVANEYLDLSAPTIAWAFVLIGLGTALCFVFEPTTKKASFYLGASVIALVMTVVPYNSLPSSPSVGTPRPANASVGFAVAFANVVPRLMIAQANEPTTELSFRVIDLSDSEPGGIFTRVLVSVFDKSSKDKWQFELRVPRGGAKQQSWDLPASDERRTFLVRAEADNYKIYTREAVIPPGAQSVVFPIILMPTELPLWVQKFFKAYKF